MKILVDAFGGDNAPIEVVKGSVEALKENKDFILYKTTSSLLYALTRLFIVSILFSWLSPMSYTFPQIPFWHLYIRRDHVRISSINEVSIFHIHILLH